MKLYIFLFVLIANSFATFAASTNNDPLTDDYQNFYNFDNPCSTAYDPYEKFNRKIYKFNLILDTFILRPIAVSYDRLTNNYTKARVGSFVSNINTPLTTVNYGLQLNFNNGIKSLWRFIINTTFGIGGMFDVATKMGLEVEPQTFGNTLARYGVAPGPYIMLPFFGGTTMRDITDPVATNIYLNPLTYTVNRNTLVIYNSGKLIHERAVILPFTEYVMQNSTDSYIAIRSSIYQNRESKIKYPKNFVCPNYKQ